ncbi:MAG: hypothetical protein Q7V57_18540 [Actinomycetota bacterium]|nr:hypothetical protein [Actinomycetota bacterium]
MNDRFEEKSFETAANYEFAQLGGAGGCPACGLRYCAFCGWLSAGATIDIWSPGQVLEGALGFDVLVDVQGDASRIGALIGAAIPPGMYWQPMYGHHPGVTSAPSWASLFIQYKRPDWVTRRRGKFLKLFPGPFHRFALDANQHAALIRLRSAAAGQALALYASPRFHTNTDLAFHRSRRLVLERTAFIDVGTTPGHQHGAYDESIARLCSEPEEVSALGLPALLAAVRRLDLPTWDSVGDGLRAHLEMIALAVEPPTQDRDTPSSVDRPVEFRIESILSFVAQNNLTWLLCAVGR